MFVLYFLRWVSFSMREFWCWCLFSKSIFMFLRVTTLLLEISINRISAGNGLKLFSMKIKATFLFWFWSHLKYKIIYFFSKFWFFYRHWFESILLRCPLNLFLWVTLIYHSERVIKICNSIKNFDIFWCIDAININPHFIFNMTFFSSYILNNNFFILFIISKWIILWVIKIFISLRLF